MNLLKAQPWDAVFATIDIKEARVVLRDGTTPTAVEYEVKLGEGNLTYSERRNVDYILDRGNLDDVRLGDQIPMEIRLDANWEYITGGSDTAAVGTVEDFMKKRGVYAANVSTDTDSCRPYAIDIVILFEPNCTTLPRSYEDITLADFRYETIDHDLRAGTLSFTGQCNATEAVPVRHDP